MFRLTRRIVMTSPGQLLLPDSGFLTGGCSCIQALSAAAAWDAAAAHSLLPATLLRLLQQALTSTEDTGEASEDPKGGTPASPSPGPPGIRLETPGESGGSLRPRQRGSRVARRMTADRTREVMAESSQVPAGWDGHLASW